MTLDTQEVAQVGQKKAAHSTDLYATTIQPSRPQISSLPHYFLLHYQRQIRSLSLLLTEHTSFPQRKDLEDPPLYTDSATSCMSCLPERLCLVQPWTQHAWTAQMGNDSSSPQSDSVPSALLYFSTLFIIIRVRSPHPYSAFNTNTSFFS